MSFFKIVDAPIEYMLREKELSLCRKSARKWNVLTASAQTKRIKLNATNSRDSSSSTSNRPFRYALALIDEEKKSVELFDAEVLIPSKSVIENEDGSQQDSKESDLALEDYMKSKILLGESFGTKKTRQILSSYERHRIDVNQMGSQETFIANTIDSAINSINSQSNGDKAVEGGGQEEDLSDESAIFPRRNINASKVEEVYKLNDVIPKEVYSSIMVQPFLDCIKSKNREQFETLILENGIVESVVPRLNSLMGIKQGTSDNSLTHTLRCLISLNILLSFRNLNEGKVNGDLCSLIPLCTAPFEEYLKNTFTESIALAKGASRLKLSTLCRDRLIIYISVLILLLDGFRLNATRLASILKLTMIKTTEYLKAVGCTFESANDETSMVSGKKAAAVKVAVLKVPIDVNVMKRKARGMSRGRS